MSTITANLKAKQTKAAAKVPRKKAQSPTAESEPEISLPPAHDWRTTDEDEINRRRLRAREGSFVIRNSDARFPVFSTFSVGSGSGLTYAVEIRDVAGRQFACVCQDFRNGVIAKPKLHLVRPDSFTGQTRTHLTKCVHDCCARPTPDFVAHLSCVSQPHAPRYF